MIGRDFIGEYTHINLEVTKRLTSQATLILTSLMEHVDFYVSHRTSKTCWTCCRSPEHPKEPNNCKYPQFKRVRILEYKNGRLSCSCPMYPTYGLPCVHMIAVSNTLMGYNGLSHHDFSVVWWKVYHLMALDNTYLEEKYSHYFDAMTQIKKLEGDGILICPQVIEATPLFFGPMEDHFSVKQNSYQCWNYTDEQIGLFWDNEAGCRVFEEDVAGLTQVSQSYAQNDTDAINTAFEDYSGLPDSEEDDDQFHLKNPYGYLVKDFTCLMDLLHGNSDMNELDRIKSFLQDCHNKKKKELSDAKKDDDVLTHPDGEKYPRFVSCNNVSEVRRKTHGTKYI